VQFNADLSYQAILQIVAQLALRFLMGERVMLLSPLVADGCRAPASSFPWSISFFSLFKGATRYSFRNGAF